jgi:CRISPR-associated protein (TIGR02584 family)
MSAATPPGGLGRRPVLLCLAGLSPAVVTEALYALAVVRRPPIYPAEVVIVTTGDAAAVVEQTLLGPSGAIERLVAEYRLPAGTARCPARNVHVLRDARGRPLRDIRTSADSRIAGEQIAAVLARLREQPDVELHCSVAGGRKTMAALLACALQLVARPGDRLYHVLIDPRFERLPTFFYPPRRPRRYTLDGSTVHSQDARIELAEIPILRLGAAAEALGLGGDLLRRVAQLEAAMDERFRPPPLAIRLRSGTLEAESTVLRLPPQDFALYAFYARRRQACAGCRATGASGCPACHPDDDEIFERGREEIRRLWRVAGGRTAERFELLLRADAADGEALENFREWLRQGRSRLARRLEAVKARFDWGRVYGVATSGRRRGLRLAPDLIRIDAGPAAGTQR